MSFIYRTAPKPTFTNPVKITFGVYNSFIDELLFQATSASLIIQASKPLVLSSAIFTPFGFAEYYIKKFKTNDLTRIRIFFIISNAVTNPMVLKIEFKNFLLV